VVVTFLCLLSEIKRGGGEKNKRTKERESILMPNSIGLKRV
jgi:hypothetical protein